MANIVPRTWKSKRYRDFQFYLFDNNQRKRIMEFQCRTKWQIIGSTKLTSIPTSLDKACPPNCDRRGTSAKEPRMFAYALTCQGLSVTTEETRLLKEEAYECLSQRSTTVTIGWYRAPFLLRSLTHTFLH